MDRKQEAIEFVKDAVEACAENGYIEEINDMSYRELAEDIFEKTSNGPDTFTVDELEAAVRAAYPHWEDK